MKVQKRSKTSVAPLPDDVIMEILTRMSAQDVLKCRGVCRRWRALISTQPFQQMHLKAKACRSLMILVQKRYKNQYRQELLLLDKWEQPRKRSTILRDRAYLIDNCISNQLQLSYDGLICFKNGSRGFTIMNPISEEVVRVDMAKPGFEAFGMFFNPPTKEYCILLGTHWRDKEFQILNFTATTWRGPEFQILNLGAQPCCRALRQPDSFQHKLRDPWHYPPVVIDDATIYWVVEYSNDIDPSCEKLIMVFDIKTEVFTFLPHPDPTNDHHLLKRSDVHIINIDGCLSFVQSKITDTKSSLIINIWALKDTGVTLWIKTHSFSIDIDQFNIREWAVFRIMALVKGELLLRYLDCDCEVDHGSESLHAYSLELGTLRKIGKTYKTSNFCIYEPSFVSLRDCKPKICI